MMPTPRAPARGGSPAGGPVYRRRNSGRASPFWSASPRWTNRMPVVSKRSLFFTLGVGLLVYRLLAVTCHATHLLRCVIIEEAKVTRYWPSDEKVGETR